VATSAEGRISNSKGDIVAVDQDFDTRPKGFSSSETDHLMHAKPIPEVIATLKQYLNGDESPSLGVTNGMSRFPHSVFDFTCIPSSHFCRLTVYFCLYYSCHVTVFAEVRYCIGMLEYIVARLISKSSVTAALDSRHFRDSSTGTMCAGSFLPLHCGHNNQFSFEERRALMKILEEAVGSDGSIMV
jgi:hypothetical protein